MHIHVHVCTVHAINAWFCFSYIQACLHTSTKGVVVHQFYHVYTRTCENKEYILYELTQATQYTMYTVHRWHPMKSGGSTVYGIGSVSIHDKMYMNNHVYMYMFLNER